MKPLKERIREVRSMARYTFLQSAPWSPAQENMSQLCDLLDEALARIAGLEEQLRAYESLLEHARLWLRHPDVEEAKEQILAAVRERA